MYPHKIFLDIDLYSIFMLLGVIACMVCIRVLSDRRQMKAAWQNLVLFNAVIAVLLGYASAVLFQAFYNYMESGVFEVVNNTGATFYGGLIGGTALFIIIYFVAGHILFKDGYHKKYFRMVSDLAVPCITVAHGLGRIGCLMAGCCHGPETDAWYGIVMNGVKRVPVQLLEAIFLLALAGLTFYLFWVGQKYLMPLYMVCYGIWRFIAENIRADHRGETIVDFWSPSQLVSVLLIVGGIALFAIEYYIDRKKKQDPTDTPEVAEDTPADDEETAS